MTTFLQLEVKCTNEQSQRDNVGMLRKNEKVNEKLGVSTCRWRYYYFPTMPTASKIQCSINTKMGRGISNLTPGPIVTD